MSSTPAYLIRCIEAAHFLLDKDYNLVLYEFGMFSGGVLPDKNKFLLGRLYKPILGCFGYIDPSFLQLAKWYEETDVWAFGIILVGSISEKVFIVDDYAEKYGIRLDSLVVEEWAIEEHERRKLLYGDKVSPVHESLEEDSDFESAEGIEVPKLAMQCLDEDFDERPTADEVQRLSELHRLKHPSEPWTCALSRL